MVSSEDVKNKALEQVKSLNTEKLALIEDSDVRANQKLVELEKELEDKTVEYETTIKEMQQKSEEQLSQLKSFFDGERERLEQRIA